jgi:hypothetical protein
MTAAGAGCKIVDRARASVTGEEMMSSIEKWFGTMAVLLLISSAAAQQNKLGLPNPDKADLPYLIHASRIVAAERSEAGEVTNKNELIYTVPGVSSPVKTPLASPEFLFLSETIDPHDLTFFRFESKGGRRELLFQKKKKVVARTIRLTVFPVEERLFKVRVDESLQSGEYCLTPNGTNAVFCFGVF